MKITKKDLEQYFGTICMEYAQEIIDDGDVVLLPSTQYEKEGIIFDVDDKICNINIEFSNGIITDSYCGCDAYDDFEKCRHMAAVMLATITPNYKPNDEAQRDFIKFQMILAYVKHGDPESLKNYFLTMVFNKRLNFEWIAEEVEPYIKKVPIERTRQNSH